MAPNEASCINVLVEPCRGMCDGESEGGQARPTSECSLGPCAAFTSTPHDALGSCMTSSLASTSTPPPHLNLLMDHT